jgi:hypothetical protein
VSGFWHSQKSKFLRYLGFYSKSSQSSGATGHPHPAHSLPALTPRAQHAVAGVTVSPDVLPVFSAGKPHGR